MQWRQLIPYKTIYKPPDNTGVFISKLGAPPDNRGVFTFKAEASLNYGCAHLFKSTDASRQCCKNMSQRILT